MKIHLAYENIDAELELVPTHSPLKRYHISTMGDRATYQRFIKFDAKLSAKNILQKEDLIQKLKDTDDEIDIELAGKKISKTSRITVTEDNDPVYNYSMFDVLTLPDGTKRERLNGRIAITSKFVSA